MTPINKSVEELWCKVINAPFYSVTYEQFYKARIINLISSILQNVLYKENDPNRK